ncbi:MAG: DEAD/DEAH box helicase, partial [Clostridia bacterium]|nr:DEAD/DEAH box helicase [Clostridia bacterium]
MELRDYQAECVKAIDDMESGRGLVSMATGLGKTVVFSRIKRKGRVLILSHREELVSQPLKYYDCPCGVEQGENRSHGEEVVSASVQSLARRLDRFSPDDFDTIITDEAHHAAAPTYKKIYAYFRPRLHIGFTATPSRGDKVRLDDVFDKIIFTRDLRWGIINGWLTDVMCLRVNVSYDLRGVKRRLGDFVAADLDRAVNTVPANREVADICKKYAKGQTLIFASGVAHAENIAARIEGAVAVSASTPNRASVIEAFKRKEIRCLVNCMVFTEGTDLPMIETIIIARPTQNQSLYAQMVGRGLRKYEGKKFLTLVDCVGVSGSLEICTAPSLMGLDTSGVPKSREKMLEGMLTDMQRTVENACDCPENWILNVQAVRLFAADQRVNA